MAWPLFPRIRSRFTEPPVVVPRGAPLTGFHWLALGSITSRFAEAPDAVGSDPGPWLRLKRARYWRKVPTRHPNRRGPFGFRRGR